MFLATETPLQYKFGFLSLFFVTAEISLVVINLLKLLILSWFNTTRSYVSRNLSISFRFSSYMKYMVGE